jgi:hypothetical protein
MAYTDPTTAVPGTVANAAIWNTYVRDNFKAMDRGLYGFHNVGTGGGFGTRYAFTVPTIGSNTSSTITGGLNLFYCVPLLAPRGGTLDRLAFEVTTLGSGGFSRQGIYAATSDNDLWPGALVVDGGEVSVNTTGVKEVTINTTLEPDVLYWAVVIFGTAAPNIKAHVAGTVLTMLGVTSANMNDANTGFTRSQTYGALPSTFPAGPATAELAAPPKMIMRYSA